MKKSLILLLFSVFIFHDVTAAFAGPWGRKKGQFFNSTTYRYYRTDYRWTDTSKHVKASLFEQHKIANWSEYGFTDKFSGGVNANYFMTRRTRGSDNNDFAVTEIWGHYKFIKRDNDVFSGHLLLGFPGPANKLDPQSGTEDLEIEPRLFYGRSWKNSWGGWSFIDASAAYRFRTGDAADQVRLDFQLGRKTENDKWLFLLQSFNKIGINNDRRKPGTDFDLLAVGLGVAYYFTPNIAWFVGVQQDVFGRNVSQATEPHTSLWLKF